jgi:methionine-gamma-lyase
MAVSLGYFDTLMSNPGSSTSSEMSDEDMAIADIGAGLIRMSVGFTGSLEQRWQQLKSGLTDIGVIQG